MANTQAVARPLFKKCLYGVSMRNLTARVSSLGCKPTAFPIFVTLKKGGRTSRVESIKLLVLAQGSGGCSVIQWAEADGLITNVPRKVVFHPCCEVRFFFRSRNLRDNVSHTCLQYGQLVCSDVLVTAGVHTVRLWDLDKVEVTFSSTPGRDVAKARPKWTSPRNTLTLLTHDDWPPPKIVGKVFYQVIPKDTGITILSFQLSPVDGPISVCTDQEESLYSHSSPQVSFSRDLLAYSFSLNIQGLPRVQSDERRFTLCRYDIWDRLSILSLDITLFSIPFPPPDWTLFDAFSSRVVFYQRPYFYIGSFVAPRY